MRKYICLKCGHPCFSAADFDHLRDKKCPVVDCGGDIAPVEDEKEANDGVDTHTL